MKGIIIAIICIILTIIIIISVTNPSLRWVKIELSEEPTGSDGSIITQPCRTGAITWEEGIRYECINAEWVESEGTFDYSLPLELVICNDEDSHTIYIHLPSIEANSMEITLLGFRDGSLIYDIIDWDIWIYSGRESRHIGEGTFPYWTVENTYGHIYSIHSGIWIFGSTVFTDPGSFQKLPIDRISITVDSIISDAKPSCFKCTLDLI